jgi:pimeloyl-ACP methyl ester carboxylesterase
MWASHYLQTNGIRLHYRRAGAGKRAMVLVHGVTDSGRSWCNFAGPLATRFALIAVDVRGHGLSSQPETGYSPADHVADLAGVIETLHLSKPLMIGHSMGGGIVAQFAADHPEAPGAVILEDPAYFEWPQPVEVAVEGFRKRMDLLAGMKVPHLVRLSYSESPLWRDADRFPWAEGKSEFTPRVIETMRLLPDIAPMLERIPAPTLLLKADASETDRRRHIRSAAGIHGRLVHIDGAGHNIHRDQPARMLAAIEEFLASLDS